MNDCDSVQAAIQALLAGHEPDLGPQAIDDHLAGCRSCRDQEAAAIARHLRSRSSRRAAPTLGLDARVSVLGRARFPAGLLAIPMAGFAAVMAFAPRLAEGIHRALEHGSADVALAAVCLLVAVQPRRAVELAPIVTAFVAALVVSDIADLLRSGTLAAQEWHHVAEVLAAATVVGLALLSTDEPRAARGLTDPASSDPG